jgi:hypothetical protein
LDVNRIVPPVHNPARHFVMAVGEYIRLNEQRFTRHALDRESTAIDLGPDALNHNAASSFGLRFRHLLITSRPVLV